MLFFFFFFKNKYFTSITMRYSYNTFFLPYCDWKEQSRNLPRKCERRQRHNTQSQRHKVRSLPYRLSTQDWSSENTCGLLSPASSDPWDSGIGPNTTTPQRLQSVKRRNREWKIQTRVQILGNFLPTQIGAYLYRKFYLGLLSNKRIYPLEKSSLFM